VSASDLPAFLQQLDPETFPEGPTRQTIVTLLNLLAALHAEVHAVRTENERLKEEIRRLKGTPGKPTLPTGRRGKTGEPDPATNQGHSSEQQRRTRKPWQKGTKLDRIVVDRTVSLSEPPPDLPADAIFKAFEPVLFQDLVLHTDNVRFLRAKFYSPSQRRVYYAPLPPGYEGEFGPGTRALVLSLGYSCHLSQALIHTFLENGGLLISRGQVCNLLTQGQARFHAEAQAVRRAGLTSAPWHHYDVTSTRVDGVTHACHLLTGPLYSVYHTLPQQDRASVVDVLRGGAPRTYRLDATALALLAESSLSQRVQRRLAALRTEETWDELAFTAFLTRHFPGLGQPARKKITDAAVIAAYRAEPEAPVVRCLVCDDAAAVRGVVEELALCWVHDARHYQKLVPAFTCHRKALARFQERYWEFYRELQAYRTAPTEAEAARLGRAFDTLFGCETLYADLNTCIARTRGHKAKLLRVLTHPELPLHNNPAELAARRRVRKRDVSFGPRSAAGVAAWDTFQSLVATTGKLGIQFYAYLKDRLTGAGEIPPLAEVIEARARVLNLGMSWDSS